MSECSQVSLKLGNNKEYSFECIGDSFIDEIYKFFLYLFGQELNLLVTNPQGMCKVYTISQAQYKKTLRIAVADSLNFQSSNFIEHCVNRVVEQTKGENGMLLANGVLESTTQRSFNSSISELIYSNIFSGESLHSDIIDRLKKLHLNTLQEQQKFLLEFVQYSPEAAKTVLNYLLAIAKWEKQQSNRPSWGEPGDPGIFVREAEQVKILFGVKDFILQKDKEGTRSVLSILLEKIVTTNPSLKEEIRNNLDLLSNFAERVYTHRIQHSWYDGDGPLRTGNTIYYYLNQGLEGGYLDQTDFLN